jgi:hypothetical protein
MRQKISAGSTTSLARRVARSGRNRLRPPTAEIAEGLPDPKRSASDAILGESPRQLPDVLSDIDVRMINGTAKDASTTPRARGKGLKVIAIGGDKLARGLTLEGLCVSYFVAPRRCTTR